MRIIVCGSRDWSDELTVVQTLFGLTEFARWTVDIVTIIEGGCPTGADAHAEQWCKDFADGEFVLHEQYPANWDRYGKSAGPRRNREMLATGCDLVVAFSNDLSHSRGTRDMVDIAKKAGVKTIVVSSFAAESVQRELPS